MRLARSHAWTAAMIVAVGTVATVGFERALSDAKAQDKAPHLAGDESSGNHRKDTEAQQSAMVGRFQVSSYAQSYRESGSGGGTVGFFVVDTTTGEVWHSRVLPSAADEPRKVMGSLIGQHGLSPEEHSRYRRLKESFDSQLAELQQSATSNSVNELRSTLEALRPNQAKNQIMKLLGHPNDPGYDEAMRDVVTILKSMPLDKRKKILSEFKLETEVDALAKILQAMLSDTGERPPIE